MSFDIPQRWEPQIEQIAHAQHITAGEALDRILEAGVERFCTQSVDAVTPPRPSATRPPNLVVAEEFPIFGVFADKPEFGAEIEKIIARRGKRYANFG